MHGSASTTVVTVGGARPAARLPSRRQLRACRRLVARQFAPGWQRPPALPVRADASGSNGAAAEQQPPRFDDTPRRRTIPGYGMSEWERHREPGRYIRHLTSLPTSHILRNVWGPALVSVGVVSLLAAYDALVVAMPSLGWLPFSSAGLGPLGLGSSALTLLLVFRTNSSYQRFTEARQLWGSMVNRCRDLVRICLAYFPATGTGATGARRGLVRWVVALAHAVRLHMRAPRDATREELQRLLPSAELAALDEAEHRPNFCLQMITQIIHEEMAGTDRHASLRLDEGLRALEDTIGGIERIYRTPIPLSYTRHTSRLLLLWLAYTPAALYGEIQLQALVVAPLLVFCLFGIDEIGVELEEPFNILPLQVLTSAIEAQATELLAADSRVKALARAAATVQPPTGALPRV